MERNVLQLLDERSVDENVDHREEVIRHLDVPARFRKVLHLGGKEIRIEDASRVDPKGLRIAELLAEAAKERDEYTLVRRLHRLTAEDRKPRDVGRFKVLQDPVLDLAREELAVIEIPLVGIEAPLAAVRTTGNEEGDAHPFAVGDITSAYTGVVHNYLATLLMKSTASSRLTNRPSIFVPLLYATIISR